MTSPQPTGPVRTIAVTGATGFVGGAIVKRLLASGFAVRALARDVTKAAKRLGHHERLAVVAGEVHDGKAPAELLRGCTACINLIGIIREDRSGPSGGQTFERMHVDAARVMVEACAAAGVRRLLHMSALGVTVDGKAEYQRTKARGEQLVRRSGLDWTVFRPGLIHGVDGEFSKQVRDWSEGKIAPWWFVPFFTRMVEHNDGVIGARMSFEPARIAPVHVDDVAAAFAAALDRDESIGEVYNLVGNHTLRWDQMLEWYGKHLPRSAQPPIIGLPALPHIWMAKAAAYLGMGSLLPFDEGMPAMAEQDQTADMTKLKAHLNLTPKSFEEAAARYVRTM
ncbi:N/A [soil metagenome]